MDLLTFLTLGIGFGFLHALEPDHLAGVATIASTTRNKWQAFRRGAVWGVGHTLAIFILYLVMQGLRLGVNETLFNKLESLVGAMLIILGFRIMYKLLKEKYHFHPHEHGDESEHLHFHSHKESSSHEHIHIPLGIGIVHGLAGSGAIILALAIETQNQFMGALYIVLFGAGSCMAMGLFSGFIAGSIDKMGGWVQNLDKVVTTSATIIATVSCFLGYGIIRNSGVF
tara:strand:+ start:11835 stop:12515 length:681 start_codon:yes stop_codon:yes gene_type:complete